MNSEELPNNLTLCKLSEANRIYDSVANDLLLINSWTETAILAITPSQTTVYIKQWGEKNRYYPVKVDSLKE